MFSKKHRFNRSIIKISLLCLIYFFQPLPSYSIDLFAIIRLPSFPISFTNEKPLQYNSKLLIERKWEEIYKKWTNDTKVTDFSGFRTKVGLELKLLPTISVGASKAFHNNQTMMNMDKDKSNLMNLTSKECGKEMFVKFSKKYNSNFQTSVKLNYEDSQTITKGSFNIEKSLSDAIGGIPGIHNTAKDFARELTWSGQYKRVLWKLLWQQSKLSEKLDVAPPNMTLEIPLDGSSQQQSFETSWNRKNRIKPYLRYDENTYSGNGENFKNSLLRFGNSQYFFKNKSVNLGCQISGKYSWFIELQDHDISFNVKVQNNLITLNPLMLFGVNEITQDEELSFSKPRGFRIGLSTKLNKRLDLSCQYALLDLKANRNYSQTKIQNFRTKTTLTNENFSYHMCLHRLETNLQKHDTSGNWNLKINLSVPQMLSESSEDEKASIPTPTPPITAPPAPSSKDRIRGGWQISLSREFYL